MKLSTGETYKNLRLNTDKYHYLEGDSLKKYQGYLLGMLCDIVDVCEENDIRYQLSGGTALGAVRHNGFIPWDDDADVNILGDDYDRFCLEFLKKYGDKYYIYDLNTPKYNKSHARVCLKGSVYRDYDTGKVDGMIFVDIFRLENVPDNVILRSLHGLLCMSMGFFFSCRSFFMNRKERIYMAEDNPEIRGICYFKIAVGALCAFLSIDTWRKIVWNCYRLCQNSHSKYVSIPSGRKHYFGEMYLRVGMENTVKMPFEGHQWCVPKDYDTYLRTLYGPNYMTPHTEAQREHHYYYEIRFPRKQ